VRAVPSSAVPVRSTIALLLKMAPGTPVALALAITGTNVSSPARLASPSTGELTTLLLSCSTSSTLLPSGSLP
jgi:hypothetical protein